MPEPGDNDKPLAGIGVLVTRPAHQSENLAKLIAAAGGNAIRFPTIEIVPPADPGPLLSLLDRLSGFDLAIFVSANAVEQTFGWLRASRRAWPASLGVACVGRASADAIAAQGIKAAHPPERFDSEALLGLSVLQDVGGKKVVIFRGDGGRELLGNALAERGAEVTYAECYRRVRPRVDPEELVDAWRRGEIHIATITSVEGLRNLHELAGETGRGWLLHTPVVVLSQAQVQACHELGWQAATLLATEASDEAILNTLETWRREQFSL